MYNLLFILSFVGHFFFRKSFSFIIFTTSMKSNEDYISRISEYFNVNNYKAVPAVGEGISTGSSYICDKCLQNSQCVVKNSYCDLKLNSCQCSNYFTPEGQTRCRGPLIFESCLEESHCKIENDAQCVRGRCFCSDSNDTVLDGHCMKGLLDFQLSESDDAPVLGQFCQSDTNCTTKGSYCKRSTRTCECQPYNRQRGSFYCRGPYIGEPCALDIHCQLENQYSNCFNGRCHCILPDWLEYGQMCYKKANLGFPCQVNFQCEARDRYAICIDENCSCDVNHYASKKTLICQKGSKLNEVCDEDLQCSSVVPYSVCIGNICQCAIGFKPGEGKLVNDCVVVLLVKDVSSKPENYPPEIAFLILMAILMSITSILAILGKYCLSPRKSDRRNNDRFEEILMMTPTTSKI